VVSSIDDIPDGTLVSGRLIRYGERHSDVDVPDYETLGVGPIVEGPLTKVPSIFGHNSCFVGQWAVEEESIEVRGESASDAG
jgi:hypothetical protein